MSGSSPIRVKTVGFFHPYCNSGGGGERVLWCAVKTIQDLDRECRIAIYTGDMEPAEDIIKNAKELFGIAVHADTIDFIRLSKRHFVEADRYPRFTMLGQSLGSMVLCAEALDQFVPHLFIDTMGYAFTFPLARLAGCKVACYVHYPTISTDMLERVAQRREAFNNEIHISQSKALSTSKYWYYVFFAKLYQFVGAFADVIMVNSTWTYNHISSLWRRPVQIVYPPCNVDNLLKLKIDEPRKPWVLSVAQFRPEKDHNRQLESFSLMKQLHPELKDAKLVLVGKIRGEDDQQRKDDLVSKAKALNIADDVVFKCSVSEQELRSLLQLSMVGIHTMWNEHFGIGVVELMAAGCIVIAHNSGGPKADIVVDLNGQKTGYLATEVSEYAECMAKALTSFDDPESMKLRRSARESTKRFSENQFYQDFKRCIQPVL
eukprot:GILJ01004131.1.p1 GENE.GILJ01004131.1~~GILJ01004131.1.p1  ORF type:complete len:468 (+),score=60.41 GILJ01004131.1:111-1406(+)